MFQLKLYLPSLSMSGNYSYAEAVKNGQGMKKDEITKERKEYKKRPTEKKRPRTLSSSDEEMPHVEGN